MYGLQRKNKKTKKTPAREFFNAESVMEIKKIHLKSTRRKDDFSLLKK